MKVTSLVLTAALAAGLAAGPVAAQDAWPTKPITYVAAFGAGSNTDTLGRIVGQKLSESLGVPVVIENKPGATGMIASSYVARAKPDGYTLLGGSIATHSINQSLFPNIDYDSAKGFEPITVLGTNPNVLVVPANSPYKTLADIIADAKANPGKLSYASTGTGTTQHLSGELLQQLAGIKLTHVPYGRSPAITDVMSGEVPMMFEGPSVMQYIQSGKVRPIAVTSKERVASLPDVPTVAETVPGYEMVAWQAVFAPAGTPQPIIDRIYADMAKALKSPEVADKYRKINVEPSGMSPAEFKEYQKAEIAKWADLIKKNNIKVD
ncbi:MAG: putative Bug-like extracytoplasmic solute binding receptor, family [Xanthobacteraceae bacterium]|nr:putative Bug-like extracytoplasmic solute binding receptor, family [Xanthobacteraceae bacterium]